VYRSAASLDVEPVYTFRGHNGPVLCLAMSPTGESCYSGGMDGAICCWNIPNSNIDPYDSYGELRCVTVSYGALRCVKMCLRCVTMCCSELRCIRVCYGELRYITRCYDVLQ